LYSSIGRLPTPPLQLALVVVGDDVVEAAAARHYFQALDFLAYGFVDDGVAKRSPESARWRLQAPDLSALRNSLLWRHAEGGIAIGSPSKDYS
jgi:hypothetical protein